MAKVYRASQVLGGPMERLLVSVPTCTSDRVNQIMLLIELATPQQLDVLEKFISCVLPLIENNGQK